MWLLIPQWVLLVIIINNRFITTATIYIIATANNQTNQIIKPGIIYLYRQLSSINRLIFVIVNDGSHLAQHEQLLKFYIECYHRLLLLFISVVVVFILIYLIIVALFGIGQNRR